MNKEKVISEVNQIINMLDENDINKIPRSLVAFFKNNAINEEKYKLNKNILLEEQNLSEETLDLISFLYSYVDGSYLSQQKNNEGHQISKNYYDDIFKNKREDNVINNNEEKSMIEYEEFPLYKKIFMKIKELLQNLRKEEKK